MSVSRRKFLKAGAFVSAAAIVLKPGTLALAHGSHWSNSLNSHAANRYGREMFASCIGDIFRVRVGKQMLDLKLVALEDVSPASRGITTGKVARTDCFSLRFDAKKPLPAAARIHTLNHGKLGDFDLFMAQSKDGSKFLQTAIVNHLV